MFSPLERAKPIGCGAGLYSTKMLGRLFGYRPSQVAPFLTPTARVPRREERS